MIQEFAIDPAAIEDHKDLRFLLAEFGFCKGRIISELTSDWAAQVHRRIATTGKLDDVRITEALVRLKEATVRRRQTEPRSFVLMAQAEHRKLPFHAILTVDLRARELPMVPFVDVVDSDLWSDPRSIRWPRSPGTIQQMLPLFASMSKIVHIVDPYMDLQQSRYRNFVQELLCLISKERGSNAKHVVTHIHISDREAARTFDRGAWIDSLRRMRGLWHPLEVQVHVWSEATLDARIHNRYLLNDRGGLQFGDSLELKPNGGEDTVHVLGGEPYKNLRKRLEENRPVRAELFRA